MAKDQNNVSNISNADETEPQNIESATVVENQQERNDVSANESSEEEMIDTNSYSEYDESDTDYSMMSTDLDEVFGDMVEAVAIPNVNNDKVPYKILTVDEIKQIQELEIINVTSDLSISRAEAIALLVHCKWDADYVFGKWADDSEEFRSAVGLCQTIATNNDCETNMSCSKCSGSVAEYLASVAFCGHKLCKTCCQDVVEVALRESSLLFMCPIESCEAAVSHDVIALVGSEADQKTYDDVFVRSYLKDYKKGRWCPTTGCNHGVLLDSDKFVPRFTCKCLYSFCYRCENEDHHPVSCAIADNWIRLLRSLHQPQDTYPDYLVRWKSLSNEQQQVLLTLRQMQNNEMIILADKQGLALDEVSFVKEAWLQAAECKRVFKWANVYDYYTLAFEENRKAVYITLLDQGTFVLEELCKVGNDLKHFIIGTNPPPLTFEDFRERLSFKSRVARNFFESMEMAIHNGYPDLESLRCAIRSKQESLEPKVKAEVETDIGEQSRDPAVETSDWTCGNCKFSNYGSTTICYMCYH